MNKQPSRWVAFLARLGFAAKGIVYALLGILAVRAAFGTGGKTTGLGGVLQTIAAQPFGKVLLILIAIGLVGYVLWRFVQAFKDPEHRGTGLDDIVRRIGYGISGLAYAALALTAVQIVMGAGSTGGNSKQVWAAKLLAQPFGQWLLGIIGAIIIGLGLYFCYEAFTAKFRKRLKLSEMGRFAEIWGMRISRFGMAARGVIFLIIGGFVVQAASQSDTSEIRSTGGTLQALDQQPNPWILGIIALGLIAYGIHMGFMARYRRIQPT